MTVDMIEEALRPAFRDMTDSVTEAILSGWTGDWSVMGGHLPRATASIIYSENDGKAYGERVFNASYPFVYMGSAMNVTASHQIHGTEVHSTLRQTIDGIRDKAPRMMAEVIADCFLLLLRAGVPQDALSDLLSQAVVADVMQG